MHEDIGGHPTTVDQHDRWTATAGVQDAGHQPIDPTEPDLHDALLGPPTMSPPTMSPPTLDPPTRADISESSWESCSSVNLFTMYGTRLSDRSIPLSPYAAAAIND
jgi:hypothetical protein